ncbi:SRPBCC family protein [Cohnella silvisoli]|uniref:SRPBCC family protein n=1 Tax=Cohnella silvisoli TaxID=2873699 RepID=A0ABV1L259_9BACL|nr:SRPBCC family protein [Cohnella silvisoli]MCD9025529.1 SRPBCC family protein [Cohnella silvisoli]
MNENNVTNDSSTNANEKELVTTRIMNAPRDLVFKAWTTPECLAQWWGPKGFTNTFHEFDLRPGGNWQFIMHGPNGVDYPNKSVFTEIVKPERIVFQHLSGHQFQVTATFEDLDGKCRLTFRMLFETVAECEKTKTYAVEANEQNFDRLEALLARLSA